MSLRGNANEVHGIPVVGAVQHMEGFTKAEIAQDIHGQPVAPIGHVLGRTPALLLVRQPAKLANAFAECSDVCQDVAFYLLYRAVGEGLGQHTTLPCVHIFIPCVVCIGRRVDEGIVELGLAHVGSEAIDVLERRVGVDRNRAGPESHKLAVFLVQSPELEMAVAFPGVVEHVCISKFRQEWPWVLG